MSEEEPELIPAKWIEIYHYCPKIIYYMGVLGARERETEYMVEGKSEQENEEERERRRITLLAKRKEKVIRRWMNLKLSSEKLGIKGEVDFIAQTENGTKIVEIKHTTINKLMPGYLYQTASYAMLAEENLKIPVRSIIIHYIKSGKTFEINLTDEIRNHVKWVTRKIKDIIEKEKIPKVQKIKECRGCGYYKVCKKL
ncbi:MAG: CRISPR-associated protein Cas4 [Nitrososphaeria archaeon]